MLSPLIQCIVYIRQCKYSDIKKDWNLSDHGFNNLLMGGMVGHSAKQNIIGSILCGSEFYNELDDKYYESGLEKIHKEKTRRNIEKLLRTWLSDLNHNHKRYYNHTDDDADFVIELDCLILDMMKEIESLRKDYFTLPLLKQQQKTLRKGEEKDNLKKRIEQARQAVSYILPNRTSTFYKEKQKELTENGPNGSRSSYAPQDTFRLRNQEAD